MEPRDFVKRLVEARERGLGRHQLEPGLSELELRTWFRKNPNLTLPADLVAFLREANGFRLHLSNESPIEARLRFLPLREIRYAPALMYGEESGEHSSVPKSWMALAQDADDTDFLVLDTATGAYREVDPIDPTGSQEVARDLNGALDWLIRYL